MQINYIRIGKDIARHVTRKTNKAEVLYDRRGVKALIDAKNSLSEFVEDIFENAQNPSLSMGVQKTKNHAMLKMTTKDGVELIETTDSVLPKEVDLIEQTPKVKGKTSKCIMGKSEIHEFTEQDSIFSKYIAQYIKGLNNPTLEIASKDAGKYNISAFVLKDGDSIITQGAYSSYKDKYSRPIKKYHFNTGDEIISGFIGAGKRRTNILPYLSKEKQEKYEILAPMLFSDRATNMFKDFYGINAKGKRLNLNALADKYWLTKERCRQIITKIITQMKIVESMKSPELGVDVRTLKPYKYLNDEEIAKFNLYRAKLLSKDSDERDMAVYVLDQLKLESKRRAVLKTFEVLNRTEN